MRRERTTAALLGVLLAAVTAQAKADDAPVDGAKLFATSCGWCHSDGGRVAGKGPKLAGSKRDEDFIRTRIKQGKQGAMPGFAHQFDDAQISQIIVYIRSLKDE